MKIYSKSIITITRKRSSGRFFFNLWIAEIILEYKNLEYQKQYQKHQM